MMTNGFVFSVRPSGGIKETKLLNNLSKEFRKTPLYKRVVLEDRFEINPFDPKWEWEIRFKNKSGFIVLNEQSSNSVRVYVYRTENDLDPYVILIKNMDFPKTTHQMFLKTMEELFKLTK